MDTAMSDESTGKPQLGTCRTRYGDSPHVKCYDCLDWRPVAAQPLVPATEGQLLGPQKHLETCAACNHGRTPCEEYKRNYGKPTSEEINALPKRIRDFIMELETNADPAGTIREVGMLRDQVAQLSAALAESQQKIVPPAQFCKARAGNVGANDPQDCDYPDCGCEQAAPPAVEGKLREAATKALALLEPIEQAELRVFKARTFLRDALAAQPTPALKEPR
jgi:hypothetical protein